LRSADMGDAARLAMQSAPQVLAVPRPATPIPDRPHKMETIEAQEKPSAAQQASCNKREVKASKNTRAAARVVAVAAATAAIAASGVPRKTESDEAYDSVSTNISAASTPMVELTDNSGSEVEQDIEFEEVVSPVPPPPVRSRTEDAKVRAKLSPLLAKTLRHAASSWGLKLEADGYALVTDVFSLQPFQEQGFTARDIEHVVHWERQENRKQRFSLRYRNHGLEIRANQGHSDLSINSQLLAPTINPLELPTHLLHGTYFRHLEQILQDGLRPMGRHHIHLFLEEGGIGRRDAEALVYVDVAKAVAAGVSFMQAENNVILSTGGPEGTIPPCCLKIVRVCDGQVLDKAMARAAMRTRYVPPHRRADWSSMQAAATARLAEAEEHVTLPAVEAAGLPKRRSGRRTAQRCAARASAA